MRSSDQRPLLDSSSTICRRFGAELLVFLERGFVIAERFSLGGLFRVRGVLVEAEDLQG